MKPSTAGGQGIASRNSAGVSGPSPPPSFPWKGAGSSFFLPGNSMGACPYGVAYDSGKGDAFVTSNSSGDVSVISDTTNGVVASLTVGCAPYGAAYDGGTGLVFASNQRSNTIRVISGAMNPVVATIPVRAIARQSPTTAGRLGDIRREPSLE